MKTEIRANFGMWIPDCCSSSPCSIFLYFCIIYISFEYYYFYIIKIGGKKFGKMKYNHRRKVEGYWVLGIVDTETNDYRTSVVKN